MCLGAVIFVALSVLVTAKPRVSPCSSSHLTVSLYLISRSFFSLCAAACDGVGGAGAVVAVEGELDVEGVAVVVEEGRVPHRSLKLHDVVVHDVRLDRLAASRSLLHVLLGSTCGRPQ